MIKTAAVIGAGTMGYGIAFQFALYGTPVIICDLSDHALVQARKRMEKYLQLFRQENYSLQFSDKEIMDHISFTTDINDLSVVDFITECATENLLVKQAIFENLDTICKKDAILASNTSSLKLSDIVKNVEGHKSRCILTHWFNPPHIVPLVELLKTENTDDGIYEAVQYFLKEHGKVTIEVKKEVSGLVANRIQIAMVREVLSLLEEGVASPIDLDLAVTAGPGFRLAHSGLLEIIDFGGLDVWKKVIELLQPEIASHNLSYPTIDDRVAHGKFGVKTGEGFYKYPNQSFDEYIIDRDARLIKQLVSMKK